MQASEAVTPPCQEPLHPKQAPEGGAGTLFVAHLAGHRKAPMPQPGTDQVDVGIG